MTRFQMIGYGVGSIGTGIFSTAPGLILLFYLTQVVGLPATLGGLVIFLPKCWDVLTDPLLGYLSDRSPSRWGRRRPFMLLGAGLLPLLFCALFWGPEGEAAFGFGLVVFVMAATAFTLFAVPYIAMPMEITLTYGQRSQVQAWRIAFTVIGVLLGGSAPALVSAFGGGRTGYQAMAVVLALCIAASFLAAWRYTRSIPLQTSVGTQPSLADTWRAIRAKRAYWVLSAGYSIQLTGFAVYSAVLPYAVSFQLGRGEAVISLIFVVLNLVALLTVGLWSQLANMVGKAQAALFASGLLVMAYVGFSLLDSAASIPIILVLSLVAGVGFGGQQGLMFSMLTDAANLKGAAADTGAGVMAGVWTAMEKVGLAFGALLAGLALDGIGLATGDRAVQSLDTIAGIAMLHGFGPAGLIVLGALFVLGYRRVDSLLLRQF